MQARCVDGRVCGPAEIWRHHKVIIGRDMLESTGCFKSDTVNSIESTPYRDQVMSSNGGNERQSQTMKKMYDRM
jgi:hypothetical protein